MKSLDDLVKDFINDTLTVDKGTYNTTNAYKENLIIDIKGDSLEIITCQNNGWLRHNVYYKDGVKEEYYDK